MRVIVRATPLSCLLLASIPLGAAMRIGPEMVVGDIHDVLHDLMPKHVHHASKDKAPIAKLQANVLPDSKKAEISSFWSHPVTLGILLGLLLVGPDQLGSVMTLCAPTHGFTSFKVGLFWGLGRSVGMLAICPIFFFLRDASGHSFDILLSKWEHCGNYFVGISMIVLAINFLMYESWYRPQSEESCGVVQRSAGSSDDSTEEDKESPAKPDMQSVIRDLGLEDVQKVLQKAQSNEVGVTSFLPSFISARHSQAALLGCLQGCCCPLAITAFDLMGRTRTGSSPAVRESVFAAVLVLASAIGAGLMGLGWGALSTHAFPGLLSAKTLYWGSCAATFVLGVLCILANVGGALQNCDWQSKMELL